MLISEFIDRTGFRPTDEYYHEVIEAEYEKSPLTKDEWCKQWKKNGGIQIAYNAMCAKATRDYHVISALETEIKTMKIESERERDTERDAMAIFLIEQAEKWSATDLRAKAIEMMGAKAYLRYKIEHNISLWEMDKELLIENLK